MADGGLQDRTAASLIVSATGASTCCFSTDRSPCKSSRLLSNKALYRKDMFGEQKRANDTFEKVCITFEPTVQLNRTMLGEVVFHFSSRELNPP